LADAGLLAHELGARGESETQEATAGEGGAALLLAEQRSMMRGRRRPSVIMLSWLPILVGRQ